jgi:hypothetical protein
MYLGAGKACHGHEGIGIVAGRFLNDNAVHARFGDGTAKEKSRHSKSEPPDGFPFQGHFRPEELYRARGH